MKFFILNNVIFFVAPLVAPKVEVISSTQNSIKIKWEKIPIEKSRGIITEYRMYYSTDKGINMEKFKEPALREFLITGKFILPFKHLKMTLFHDYFSRYIRYKWSKVAYISQGWLEGSLFNSYYTMV